jgi:5-methylcytosine-specific restriction endonuclease McrA
VTKRSGSDPRYGSRQWKRTVLAVKRRDGWRCQHCGATERLVVDHRTPHDRYPGSFFDVTNLWTLCSADNNSKRDLTVDEWKAALARRAPTQAPRDGPRVRSISSIGGRRR